MSGPAEGAPAKQVAVAPDFYDCEPEYVIQMIGKICGRRAICSSLIGHLAFFPPTRHRFLPGKTLRSRHAAPLDTVQRPHNSDAFQPYAVSFASGPTNLDHRVSPSLRQVCLIGKNNPLDATGLYRSCL